MKTIIKVLDKEFELKSKLVNSGVNFPNNDSDTLHNEFRVTITRVTENGRISRSFKFYDSMANFEKGLDDLESELDLKLTFRCFIEDGFNGSETFEDFCSNYGYDTDSIKSNKIYKLCQKSLNKLYDLGIFTSELTDILEELSKMGVE